MSRPGNFRTRIQVEPMEVVRRLKLKLLSTPTRHIGGRHVAEVKVFRVKFAFPLKTGNVEDLQSVIFEPDQFTRAQLLEHPVDVNDRQAAGVGDGRLLQREGDTARVELAARRWISSVSHVPDTYDGRAD